MSEQTPPQVPLDDLLKTFSEPKDNYERLRADMQAVRGRRNVWDTDTVLERYVNATDHTIGLLDGSISRRALEDPSSPEHSKEQPDTVIWLDKSARPVSWFVDSFWEQMAKDGAEKPTDEFLNIDRVNWFTKQGYRQDIAESRLGPEAFDINKVPQKDIDRIRAIFSDAELSEEHWQDQVWENTTRLDGKNILIIDEVKNRGGTLFIAQQLLKRAIPEATVSGDYFWEAGSYSIDGKSAHPDKLQMESAPVWYDSHNSYGRGVGEISQEYYEHLYDTDPTPEHLKLKLGWIALSAPHFDPDTYEELPDSAATQLKQDIAYLTYGNTLRAPSKHRDDDEMIGIINDQGLSVQDFKAIRETRSKRL